MNNFGVGMEIESPVSVQMILHYYQKNRLAAEYFETETGRKS